MQNLWCDLFVKRKKVKWVYIFYGGVFVFAFKIAVISFFSENVFKIIQHDSAAYFLNVKAISIQISVHVLIEYVKGIV